MPLGPHPNPPHSGAGEIARFLGSVEAALAACAAAITLASTPALAQGFEPLDLGVRALSGFEIARDTTMFGELEFRGGLELSARHRSFGALSGPDYDPETNEIVAVADTGHWFTAELVESEGRLIGLAEPRIAPLLDEDGRTLGVKWNADAESLRLTIGSDGKVAIVAFEQSNMVRAFPYTDDIAMARADILDVPDSVARLGPNRGLETVAVAPDPSPLGGGTMVLLAERRLDGHRNHTGWVVNGPRAGTFAIRRIGNYDITDADFLPNGDLFILERLFAIGEGIGTRIRRIGAADIKPGATVDGPVVLEADLRHQIDNMEGIALREGPNGETIVMLVSDNNHNILQRTLLLEFVWREPIPPLPRPRPAV